MLEVELLITMKGKECWSRQLFKGPLLHTLLLPAIACLLCSVLLLLLRTVLRAAQGHTQSEVEPAHWAMAQDEGIEPSIDNMKVHPDIKC